jgi:hypothetical protein
MWMAFCSLHFVMQAKQREEITTRYGLETDDENQVHALCCANCDLMQQEKELVYREEEKKKGFVAEQPAPVAGMAYGSDEKDSVKE